MLFQPKPSMKMWMDTLQNFKAEWDVVSTSPSTGSSYHAADYNHNKTHKSRDSEIT